MYLFDMALFIDRGSLRITLTGQLDSLRSRNREQRSQGTLSNDGPQQWHLRGLLTLSICAIVKEKSPAISAGEENLPPWGW